jgi:glycolate oxidase
MTPAADVHELGAELRGGRLITDPELIESYRRDQTHAVPAGTPRAVVQARDVADVVATLRWASRNRVPVIPRGSGTSLAGGATAIDGCIMLSLTAMTRILELSAAERLAVVEAGVVTADLDRAARAHGLMYAPDPASYEISTIGGNLATNAGGLRCLKYGVTRDAALGLEVVLADGRVIRTGRRTVKGVTGYDLTGHPRHADCPVRRSPPPRGGSPSCRALYCRKRCQRRRFRRRDRGGDASRPAPPRLPRH